MFRRETTLQLFKMTDSGEQKYHIRNDHVRSFNEGVQQ